MDIEAYARKHVHYWDATVRRPALRFLLENNSFRNIIDVGCGDGALLFALKESGLLQGFEEVWAVDISDVRLDQVRRVAPDIRVLHDNAQELGQVPSDHFDLVISSQVIEHVEDDSAMIRTLKRVATKSAVIYLETVLKRRYAWYFNRNRHGRWVLDPTHEREYTAESQLLDKIGAAGLVTACSIQTPERYPLLDFFVKRLHFRNRELYGNPVLRALRRVKVPILGYLCWQLILVKR
ncbi:MAG: class I SAM-dependent methyltransferase [Kiritimatiellae bacterium]|nr:class I SAM-dependent methyltransferase [Kiritimatiellia bacterium]